MSNCGSKKMKYGGSVKKMKEGGPATPTVLPKTPRQAVKEKKAKLKMEQMYPNYAKKLGYEEVPLKRQLEAKLKGRRGLLEEEVHPKILERVGEIKPSKKSKSVASNMEKGGPATPKVLPKPKPKATATSTNMRTGATRGAGDDAEYMRKAAAANMMYGGKVKKMEEGGEVRGMGRAYQGKPRACKVR
jgi:hypothetical protein